MKDQRFKWEKQKFSTFISEAVIITTITICLMLIVELLDLGSGSLLQVLF